MKYSIYFATMNAKGRKGFAFQSLPKISTAWFDWRSVLPTIALLSNNESVDSTRVRGDNLLVKQIPGPETN